MYLCESIKNAISSFARNKERLIAGIISISISVGTMTGTMVISEGNKAFLKKEIEKVGLDLISVSSTHKPFLLTHKDVEMIKGIPNVSEVIGYICNHLQIQYFNKSTDGLVVGHMLGIKEMARLSLKKGRFFNYQEVESRANVCVIGKNLAVKLFEKKNPVGERVFIQDVRKRHSFKIVGVLNEVGIFSMIAAVSNDVLIIPLTFFEKYMLAARLQGKVGWIVVQVIDNSKMKRVVEGIKREFTLKRKGYSCNMITQESLIADEYEIMKKINMIGLLLSIIFLTVAGIGIMMIMLKSVTERTKEIGIRKAIGAKKKEILVQFLIETLIIGILGCFVGIIMGMTGACFIAKNLIVSESLIQQSVSGILSLGTIFITCGVGLTIAILSGVYPAYRAASVNPIDAIRYE